MCRQFSCEVCHKVSIRKKICVEDAREIDNKIKAVYGSVIDLNRQFVVGANNNKLQGSANDQDEENSVGLPSLQMTSSSKLTN